MLPYISYGIESTFLLLETLLPLLRHKSLIMFLSANSYKEHPEHRNPVRIKKF